MMLETGMVVLEKISLVVAKMKVKKVVSLQEPTMNYYLILTVYKSEKKKKMHNVCYGRL